MKEKQQLKVTSGPHIWSHICTCTYTHVHTHLKTHMHIYIYAQRNAHTYTLLTRLYIFPKTLAISLISTLLPLYISYSPISILHSCPIHLIGHQCKTESIYFFKTGKVLGWTILWMSWPLWKRNWLNANTVSWMPYILTNSLLSSPSEPGSGDTSF